MDKRLTKKIKSEYNINIKFTVRLLLNSIYQNRGFRDIQYADILETIISDHGLEKMICGGMSPRDRAMLHIADKHQVETYYIPHGAANYYQIYPDTDTTHIGFGTPELKTYDLFRSKYHSARIELLGRPYLPDLIRKYNNCQTNIEFGSGLNILIATQPYSDHIRKYFINSTIEALSNKDHLNVRIKIHPSEESNFYQMEIDRQHITISSNNLVGELKNADVVITINSNVGLEAITTGTPCICVNLWNAFTRAQYAEFGPIPVFKQKSDIKEWFDTVSTQQLEHLLEKESRYVRRNYIYDDKSAKRISKYIINCKDKNS